MPDVMILNNHGFADSTSSAVADAYGPLIRKQVEELTAVIDQTLATTSEIDRDGDLTSRGKSERITQARAAALKEIGRLSGVRRAKLDADLQFATKTLPQHISRPDANTVPVMLQFLKEQEIRAYLRTLNDIEREAIVMAAASAGDRDTLLAVQESPKLFKLMDDEAFGKAKQRYLAQQHPDKVERIGIIESAISTFDANVRLAQRLMGLDEVVAPRDSTLTAEQLSAMAGVGGQAFV